MQCKVDGLIVCNTTVSRPESLTSALKAESGGLSGAPLKELATKTVADFYRLTNGKVFSGTSGVGTREHVKFENQGEREQTNEM